MVKSLPKIDSKGLTSFIPTEEIHNLLLTETTDKHLIRDIISKSLSKKSLSPQEMAALLNTKKTDLIEEIFAGARKLKEDIYGKRIVIFAPLYVGNDCVNNCSYCGFRANNKDVVRKTLTLPELENETLSLVTKGHKRLIMVYGEHPKYDADFIHDTVKKVYSTKYGNGEIRRVNINAAPFDVEGFKKIKEAGIGTYQIFQETYHEPTYKSVHPSGPKSDFLWRLHGLDRAFEAGIEDVGIGALIGLYDHKFEALSLLYHTIHLEEKFGVGPHTISFPRIEPAINTKFAANPPAKVSDDDFKKMIAILRLAVPYTGLILTCRENIELRNDAISFGISQVDAGSDIGVGAYSNSDNISSDKKSQFVLNDNRSLDEVVGELCAANQLPSFCTGCYRLKRTGEHFMECAVPGFVKNFCTPNGILTLLEYILDYASPDTKAKGLKVIEENLSQLSGADSFKQQLIEKINEVKQGNRDLFF